MGFILIYFACFAVSLSFSTSIHFVSHAALPFSHKKYHEQPEKT